MSPHVPCSSVPVLPEYLLFQYKQGFGCGGLINQFKALEVGLPLLPHFVQHHRIDDAAGGLLRVFGG